MWVDYRGPLSTAYNDGYLSVLHCFTNSLRASMIIFPSAIFNSLKAPCVNEMIGIEIVRIVRTDDIQQYIPV